MELWSGVDSTVVSSGVLSDYPFQLVGSSKRASLAFVVPTGSYAAPTRVFPTGYFAWENTGESGITAFISVQAMIVDAGSNVDNDILRVEVGSSDPGIRGSRE